MSTEHSKKAAAYIGSEPIGAMAEKVSHHDATFWNVRAKRDRMAAALPEWEDLREMASEIKTEVLGNLESYIDKFEAAATANGVIVHRAADADEYNAIVYDILRKHNVSKVVKSKSMLTEECHLNENLEKRGIEVVETDLGERILQMMHLAPSHIVMPALHVPRAQIRDCFKEQIPEYEEFVKKYKEMSGRADVPSDDATMLTFVARLHLRGHFMTAGAGMTGANFGIAQTGDVVVCTNEGNADMSTAIPPLHIVSMGIEKLIPDYKAMGVFHRLLARCGTGQETTVYTSHFRGPRPGGEMHIVLVDNGRREILKQEEHWQTLKCMRCGSCMNTCPVYRRSAGYSYTYFIPGPIGINLGMAHDPSRFSDNVSACTLCCSCDNVCPVKVDLSSQIYKWRQSLAGLGTASSSKKAMSKAMKSLFSHPGLYNSVAGCAQALNVLPDSLVSCGLNPWTKGRAMMKFPRKTFHKIWKEIEKSSPSSDALKPIVHVAQKAEASAPHEFSPLTFEDPVEAFIKAAQTISGAKVIVGPVPEGVEATRGEIAVAENGCVWIPQSCEDRSYLFASEHLDFVVPKSVIVNNMHEAYAKIASSADYFSLYKFGTFISGPSKTADIEGTLVYGAQAARSVTIYLV